LAFLSVKYEVNPEKFLESLRTAQGHESHCGNLSIHCRGRIKTNVIFLIMRGSEVIAQFPIDGEFLLNKNNHLRNFMGTDRIHRYLAKKARTVTANTIKDLRVGMTHVNLKAKILEIAESKPVVTRYGNNVTVAKVLIGDETGTIKLCLWNGQMNGVCVGDVIQIENAQASMFRGERLLNLGKKGTINNEALKPRLKSIELLHSTT
jgi:replication factor A1